MNNNTGLTEKEQEIMDHLTDVFLLFRELEQEHPDDLGYVKDAVHRIQDILALRVVRRCYPEGWPKK